MGLRTGHIYVNDPAVQSFMLPGQPVYELIWDTSRKTGIIAREVTAPVRSGRLRKSIQANRPKRDGPYQNTALVFIKIGYGLYVHEGTLTTPPSPKNGSYLTVPRGHERSVISGGALRQSWRKDGLAAHPEGKPYFITRSIRGQKANPFLAEALHMAMPK